MGTIHTLSNHNVYKLQIGQKRIQSIGYNDKYIWQRIAANNGCYTVYEANDIPSYIPTVYSVLYSNTNINKLFEQYTVYSIKYLNTNNNKCSQYQCTIKTNKTGKEQGAKEGKEAKYIGYECRKILIGNKGTSLSARY